MSTATAEETLERMVMQIQEINDRTRRTETNLHKMREHLGLPGPSRPQIEVLGECNLSVTGYDVTLSQIKRAAGSGLDMGDEIEIRKDGTRIAVVRFF